MVYVSVMILSWILIRETDDHEMTCLECNTSMQVLNILVAN